ncbi:MAG TPA: hypothetical protein VNM69_21585 [Bacillus sp. (in: firmicutes)]|uniref:hypothetical protein n=1 Tax=Bacillus litorisediminis TaxID=2922713 RepID=UPI001FAE528A|nr:hypothetical protein [Bacillus litorisediminis]HWO78465.1 hypothetical protein [Bacillus sp. (in: firmicutes)]
MDLLLDFSSISTFYMIYAGILLSLGFGVLLRNIETPLVSSYSFTDQNLKPHYLLTQINKVLVVRSVIIWLFKAAKKYQFSDEDAEDSISPITLSNLNTFLGGNRDEIYKEDSFVCFIRYERWASDGMSAN